ncbi:hypothetical protein T484DRAFT_1818743, partial [Baffinella frigidus]
PDATAITSTNRPGFAIANASVTLHGFTFGREELSAQTRLGGSAAEASAWISDTAMTARFASGGRATLRMALTVGERAASATEAFSFDALSARAPPSVVNVPTRGQGGDPVTTSVFGSGLVSAGFSGAARAGGTACEESAWLSDSSVSCRIALGSQSTRRIALTAGERSASVSEAWSYDALEISSVQVNNGAPAGGETLTLTGAGGARLQPSAQARLGGTASEATEWVSETSVLARNTRGVRGTRAVGVTAGAFSYDFLGLASIGPVILATTGSQRVTFIGASFGLFDVSVGSRMGGSACEFSTWQSESSLLCLHPAGVGGNYSVVATVGELANSIQDTWTYAAPNITALDPGNGPVLGGLNLTVSGYGFGHADYGATGTLGDTGCGKVYYVSDTSLLCVGPIGTGSTHTITGANFDLNPRPADADIGETASAATYVSDTSVNVVPAAGIGRNLTVVLTILGYTEATANKFSYLAPRTLALNGTANAPPQSVGTEVTITGDNFGVNDTLTARARLGGTACESSVWYSDTTLVCAHPKAGLANPALVVTVAEQHGSSLALALTYDGPEASSVVPANTPTQGGLGVSIFGVSFASRDASPQARLGHTACEASAWTSDTAVSCVSAQGQGHTLPLAVSIQAPQYASTEVLKSVYQYYRARIRVEWATSAERANSAATGGGVVNVYGVQFGLSSPTMAARAGGLSAEATEWASDSSMTLKAPEGELSATRGGRLVAITVGLQAGTMTETVGTMTETVTYDDISIRTVAPGNTPPLRSVISLLEIAGSSFARSDSSPVARLGGTTCEASAWLSDTAATCQPAAGGGFYQTVAATINPGVARYVTEAVTFDAPSLSGSSATNGNPIAAEIIANVSGSGLASADHTPALRLDPTAFASTEWGSDTSVRGLMPPGFGAQISVIVTAGHRVDVAGTITNSFSFDAGVVIRSVQRNLPKTGAISVTIIGLTFGSFDFSMNARIGGTGTEASSWVSDSAVVARASSGRLEARVATATINRATGTVTGLLTYDAHVLVNVPAATSNGPTSGITNLALLTVFGAQLGQVEYSSMARLGGTAAEHTEWLSDTALRCAVAGGVPLYARAIAVTQLSETYNNSIATVTEAFSYDHLHVVDMYFGNTVRSGGLARNILGSNFAPIDSTVKAREGGTDCPRTDWISDTTIACYAPSGTGTGLTVEATVANYVSAKTLAFSYDDMSITATSPSNAKAIGGVLISFARLGGTACQSTRWVSDTNIYGKVPRGAGGQHTATLTINPILSTKINLFSYDDPVLETIAPVNLATEPTGLVTLTGLNFASYDSTVKPRVGATASEVTIWVAETSIKCKGSNAGTYRAHPAGVTIGLKQGTVLTYDGPTVASATPRNMNPFGGLTVSVTGRNLVPYDASVVTRVGGTSSEESVWTSETAMHLKAAHGTP